MCMKKKRIPGLKGYQTKTLQTDRQITHGKATLLNFGLAYLSNYVTLSFTVIYIEKLLYCLIYGLAYYLR